MATMIPRPAATLALLRDSSGGPQNLKFENGDIGMAPSGWFSPTPGYTAMVTAEGVSAAVYLPA